MRLDRDFREMDIAAVMRRLAPRLNLLRLEKVLKRHQQTSSDSPVLMRHLAQRYGVSVAMLGGLLRAVVGRPWTPQHKPQLQAASLAAAVDAALADLDDVKAQRLMKRLQGALENAAGLRGMAFEFRVAAHLMARGCEVDLILSEKSAPDLLVRKYGLEFEVECKSVASDTGRPIKKAALFPFWDRLLTRTANLPRTLTRGLAVTIELPGQLSVKHADQDQLAEFVSCAVYAGGVGSDIADVRLVEFDPATFPTHETLSKGEGSAEQAVKAFAQRLVGARWLHGESITTGVEGGAPLMFFIGSQQPNAWADSIFEVIKSAKGQLSGDRPGVICVNIEDYRADRLRDLVNDPVNNLSMRVDRMFGRPSSNIVNTLAFFADGDVISRSGITTLDGASYFFANRTANPDAVATLRTMFGDTAVDKARSGGRGH